MLKSIYHKLIRKNKIKITPEDYHTKVLLKGDGNLAVKTALKTGNAVMIARIGSVELKCVNFYLNYRHNKIFKLPYKKKMLEMCANLPGIYPQKTKIFDEFNIIFIDAVKSTDIMAVWYNKDENTLCKEFCPDSNLIYLDCLEPFLYTDPWSAELKNKKVLIISPFDETIKKQYAKREFLFADPDVLPEFELITYKAVQAMGGGNKDFSDWVNAYNHMKCEIQKIDFDTAIISAGAFGLPLAAEIKKMGKQAIHIGGAGQLLFGIKGKRWDQWENYTQNIYNEHWVYPPESSKPANIDKINRYEGMTPYW